MCLTCQMPDVPAPLFAMGQRVETNVFIDDIGQHCQEQGVIYGFSYNEHPHSPGWWYYIHFDMPRVFDDHAPEADLRAIASSEGEAHDT